MFIVIILLNSSVPVAPLLCIIDVIIESFAVAVEQSSAKVSFEYWKDVPY